MTSTFAPDYVYPASNDSSIARKLFPEESYLDSLDDAGETGKGEIQIIRVTLGGRGSCILENVTSLPNNTWGRGLGGSKIDF
jgi:hypothetical protein